MRLVDLEPHWIGPAHWAAPEHPFYIGVSFFCPHCPVVRRRFAVEFYPPIDPHKLDGQMFNWPDLGKHRRASGETFDTLTLLPSIGFDGHWHGHITNGECA